MATFRITAEFTNCPPEKMDGIAERIAAICEAEGHVASTWPNHPNIDTHSVVGVAVTVTTVMGGGAGL